MIINQILHKRMKLIPFSFRFFFSNASLHLFIHTHSHSYERRTINTQPKTASIAPRAETHTVYQIIQLLKKVNPNREHSVRANTVIFHRCVMVMLHFQRLKEDRAHTISSIASNCKYIQTHTLIQFIVFLLKDFEKFKIDRYSTVSSEYMKLCPFLFKMKIKFH